MADIDYGKILRRSFEITKKNKWLWVYGLVLAAFGGSSGGSGGGGGGGGSSNNPRFKNIPRELPKDLPEKTSQVLGQTTTVIKDWIAHVPLETWILLGLGIFLLILFWIGVSWVLTSWAKGALIGGVRDANEDKPVTLANTSPHGIAALKHLIIFSLISLGIGLAAFGGIFIFIGVGYLLLSFSSALKIIWLLLTGTVGGLTLIIAIILFIMVTIYAERLIVLQNYTPWQAWKKGLNLSKNNFLHTLLMGIINNIIGCSAGCLSLIILLLVLGIPAGILIALEFKDGFHIPSITFAIAMVFLFMIFVYLNILIRAILTVFNYSSWTLFFEEVMSQEKKS